MKLHLLHNYLIVGALLFRHRPGRLPQPAEHDRDVPVGRDDAARRVAQPGRLGPLSQRLGRPDAGDLHPRRGGLRSGHRAGPGADAVPTQRQRWTSPSGTTCAKPISRRSSTSRCPRTPKTKTALARTDARRRRAATSDEEETDTSHAMFEASTHSMVLIPALPLGGDAGRPLRWASWLLRKSAATAAIVAAVGCCASCWPGAAAQGAPANRRRRHVQPRSSAAAPIGQAATAPRRRLRDTVATSGPGPLIARRLRHARRRSNTSLAEHRPRHATAARSISRSTSRCGPIR